MDPVTRSNRPSRRVYLLVTLFTIALAILPFIFWRQTWFGRPLGDADIERSLSDTSKPRQTQHALVQIGERLGRGERGVQRWYPQVIRIASEPHAELRQTAAWIMGQDARHQPFHEALVKLLADPEPLVRRNAALALANFHDEAALPVIRQMLEPSTIEAPASGPLQYRLKEGQYVNPGTLVARIGAVEVRAHLPGTVRALRKQDGASVVPGEPLGDVSPDTEHAWEALRALVVLGQARDLESVQRYARGVPGMPARIQQQAALTLRAIQSRPAQ